MGIRTCSCSAASAAAAAAAAGDAVGDADDGDEKDGGNEGDADGAGGFYAAKIVGTKKQKGRHPLPFTHLLSPGPVWGDYRVCNQAEFWCRDDDSKDELLTVVVAR